MTSVKKIGQGRLFQSGFLELFTRTNTFIHIVTYTSVILFFLYLNKLDLLHTVLYAFIGMIGWTLTEYLTHRFLFHINHSAFQYMIHGVHHEYPRDRERLMMPPVPGIVIITVFYGIWFLIFMSHTAAFMVGFIFAYMVYTFIHFIIHTWKPIPGLKFLWAHHHKHHNPAFQDKAFGVSTPIWDYVFGTMPHKNEK